MVAAVVPYVPTGELRLLPRDVLAYEPRRALDGGSDGAELLRRAVVEAAGLLRRSRPRVRVGAPATMRPRGFEPLASASAGLRSIP